MPSHLKFSRQLEGFEIKNLFADTTELLFAVSISLARAFPRLSLLLLVNPGGGGVRPYVTLTGTCGPIGYGFHSVLS